MSKEHTCPKCGSAMIAGFMKDVSAKSPTGTQVGVIPEWVRGTPEFKITFQGKVVDYRNAERLQAIT